MRGGRPLPLVLAMASAAVAGLGVTVSGRGVDIDPAPAGRRERRIFGYDNIRRHLQRQKRTWGASGSLAGHPHEHKRETARRMRQQSRDAERRGARLACLGNPVQPPVDRLDRRSLVGISRRGRYLFA